MKADVRNIVLGILLLCSLSCTENGSPQPMYKKMEHQYIDREFLFHVAVQQTKKDLKQLYKFRPCMVGGGISGALQSVELWGDIPEDYTIEEARRMVVNGTIIFQNNINSIRTLRPAMRVYPFPLDGLSLVFFPHQPVKGNGPFFLDSFSMKHGRILYKVDKPEGSLEIIKEETFEEAKKIVEEERAKAGISTPLSLPLSQIKEIPVPRNPTSPRKAQQQFMGLPRERKLKNFLHDFCNRLGEQHRLLFLWTGDFSGGMDGTYFGISFYGFDAHTLEESRVLTRDLFNKYYTVLQTAPEIKEFQELERKAGSFPNTPDIPPVREACLKITFWDEDFNPQKPPYIAQITFLNEKFSFYQVDPVTHELSLVLEAPYEKFMKEEKKDNLMRNLLCLI